MGTTWVATVLGVAVAAAAPVHAASPTYSGRAYAICLTGVAIGGTAVPDTCVGDTGQLPAAGGTLTVGPGTQTLPMLGTVTVATENTTGTGGTASSLSSVASVSLAAGSTSILSVSALTATTSVSCSGAPSETSSVGSLSVGGTLVPINPAANTMVSIPPSPLPVIATVTFNQQSYNSVTKTASASALVITFPANSALNLLAPVITGTITISHAESDFSGDCPAAATTPTPTATPASGVQAATTTSPFTSGPSHPFPAAATGLAAAGLAVALGAGFGPVLLRRRRRQRAQDRSS